MSYPYLLKKDICRRGGLCRSSYSSILKLTKGEVIGNESLRKLEVLKDAYTDEVELERVLGKLLDIVLSQYRLRLEKYENDLRKFESRYGMESETFYRRFEAGELGDAMDFFEWAGLYELRQDIIEKIRRLESAL